jgi:hypothetical protein
MVVVISGSRLVLLSVTDGVFSVVTVAVVSRRVEVSASVKVPDPDSVAVMSSVEVTPGLVGCALVLSREVTVSVSVSIPVVVTASVVVMTPVFVSELLLSALGVVEL